MWTKPRIANLLQTNNRAVERALIAIYKRQTADEKAVQHTRHNNGQGFSAAHARKGTYYARWCLAGKSLTGDHLVKARLMAMHYIGQLVEVSNSKAG